MPLCCLLHRYSTDINLVHCLHSGRSEQDVVVEDELESETLLGEGKSSLLAREASEDGFSRMKMNRPLSSKQKPGAVISTMDVS